jgi:hypothetical protein
MNTRAMMIQLDTMKKNFRLSQEKNFSCNEADAAEKYGENMISVVRARIETEFMEQGKSATESEKRAKADPKFEDYLKQYKEVRLEKMKALAEHEDNRNRIMFKMSMNKAVMEEMKFSR